MYLMNAYSKDLRLKALAAIDRGVPRREVQDLFGLSRSTIKRWLKRRRQTGDVAIHEIPGRPSVKGEALRRWLPEHLERNPDLTLKEHCEAFEAYVEHFLAPSLSEGQMVVMDNLGAPRPKRIRELIEARGAESSCSCRPTRRTIEPHRASVLEDKERPQGARGAHPRSPA